MKLLLSVIHSTQFVVITSFLSLVASCSSAQSQELEKQPARPSKVQAAFDAMEVDDDASFADQHGGSMGKKVPVMEAISMFRKRVAVRPDHVGSQVVLGQLYLRLAKETKNHAAYQAAEKQLRQALVLDPKSQSGLTSLAMALESQHRFREALAVAQSAYQNNSSNTQALAICGDCQLQLGRIKLCERIYQTLASEAPNEPAVLARQAQLAELTGDNENAISLLKTARNLASAAGQTSDAVAWYSLRIATAYQMIGRHEDAESEFTIALKQDHGLTQAKVGIAEMLIAKGQTQLGVELLQEAVSDGASVNALTLLADLKNLEGDRAEAQTLLDQAEALLLAEMKTLDGAHCRQLSLFYSDHGRHLEQAVQLAKQDLLARADIYCHDALAWALYQNGQQQEAAAVMPKALSLGTLDASLHYHAALIFHEVGDDVKALQHLQSIKRINPKFHPSRAKNSAKLLAQLEESMLEKR